MSTIARDLVYYAQAAGRLGAETLSIHLSGRDASPALVIDQMTTVGLPAKAPLIQVWHYPSSSDPRNVALDMEQITSPHATQGDLSMRRYRLAPKLPDIEPVEPDELLLAATITGRDAPMRSIFYQDHSQLPLGLHTRMSTYRTIVMIEVAREEDE